MNLRLTWVTLCALLAATAAYVWLHPPENLALGRGALTAVPTEFGPWNGTELSFEDAVVEELQSDDLLIRRYERGDRPVWLCIVYHQHRRYGAHDPQLCYESQGYLIEQKSQAQVDDGHVGGLTVNRFVADRPRHQRLVYYWWATRGVATADREEMRRRMMLSGTLDNRSWGAFVRVETAIETGHESGAEQRLQDFASRVARALPAVFERADTSGRTPS